MNDKRIYPAVTSKWEPPELPPSLARRGGMQRLLASEPVRHMPFHFEVPLSDLWRMAIVQLREAEERLAASEELLAEPTPTANGPNPKGLVLDDDLVFA